MLRRAVVVLGLAVPCAASAAPATSEEAARLTTLFETYVGKPASGSGPSVTVVPQGESYKASFDLARMATVLKPLGVDVVATEPYVAILTPAPDGTWHATYGNVPQFGVTTKKGLTYSIEMSGVGSDLIFDPKLRSVIHSETTLGGAKSSVTIGGQVQHTELTEKGRQVLDAKGPSPDDVSTAMHQTDEDVRYMSRVEPAPADAMTNSTTRAGSFASDVRVDHARNGALLDLWAFLVAHPSRDQVAADQIELKRRILAMIPFATALDLHAVLKDFAVDTAKGSGKAAALTEAVSYDSSRTDAGLTVSLGLKDFALAVKGGLPDWIAALIPSSVDINLATSPLDLGKATRILVEQADFSKDDPFPSTVVAKAVAALAPNGGPTYALKPSSIANATMSLAGFGEFAGDGTGKAKIEAKGLEDEIAIIGKSANADPIATQAVQLLSLARAFAVRTPDGRLSWEIVSGPAGSLTVNGKAIR